MPYVGQPDQTAPNRDQSGKFNLGSTIAGAIPVVGGLLSNLINRRRQRKYEDELRKYNSPAAQIQRLKDAGVSTSAFFTQGSTGNASMATQPELDNTGGDAISAYQNTRLNKLQQSMMQEELRLARYRADIAEKDRDDYLGSQYNKQDTNLERLEGQRLRNELTRIKTQIEGLDYQVQKELTDDGTLSNITRQKLVGLVQDNKNAGQLFINMVNQNDKTTREILNLITQDQKTRQEIVNLATSNKQMQVAMQKMLTDERLVKEMIHLAYLDQDEKVVKIQQIVNDLDESRFDTSAKKIIFDDLHSYGKGQQTALGALPDALIYYGLDKFKLGGFVGRYSSKNTTTIKK